jgi:hypothetical protein
MAVEYVERQIDPSAQQYIQFMQYLQGVSDGATLCWAYQVNVNGWVLDVYFVRSTA